MKNLKTLYAKRYGTSVEIYDKDNNYKGRFPNTGYRPTKATKTITLNCWRWKLEWLKEDVILQPIRYENQIEDVFVEVKIETKVLIKAKIDRVAKNITNVSKINGIKVYDTVVIGNDIWYNLKPVTEEIKARFENCATSLAREYYYPIQYARIEIKEIVLFS